MALIQGAGNLINPVGAFTSPVNLTSSLPQPGQFANQISSLTGTRDTPRTTNLPKPGQFVSAVSRPTTLVGPRITPRTQHAGVLGGGFGGVPALPNPQQNTATFGMPSNLYSQHVGGAATRQPTAPNTATYGMPPELYRQYVGGPATKEQYPMIGPPTPPGYVSPRLYPGATPPSRTWHTRTPGGTKWAHPTKEWIVSMRDRAQAALASGRGLYPGQASLALRYGLIEPKAANPFADVTGTGNNYGGGGYRGYGYGRGGYGRGGYGGGGYGVASNMLNWRVATG